MASFSSTEVDDDGSARCPAPPLLACCGDFPGVALFDPSPDSSPPLQSVLPPVDEELHFTHLVPLSHFSLDLLRATAFEKGTDFDSSSSHYLAASHRKKTQSGRFSVSIFDVGTRQRVGRLPAWGGGMLVSALEEVLSPGSSSGLVASFRSDDGSDTENHRLFLFDSFGTRTVLEVSGLKEVSASCLLSVPEWGGELFAQTDIGGLYRFDLISQKTEATGEVLLLQHSESSSPSAEATCFAKHPSLNGLVVGTDDAFVRLWSRDTEQCEGEFAVPSIASTFCFSEEENETLLVGCEGGQIDVWDVRFLSGGCIRSFSPSSTSISGIVPTGNNDKKYVSASYQSVTLWKLRPLRIVRRHYIQGDYVTSLKLLRSSLDTDRLLDASKIFREMGDRIRFFVDEIGRDFMVEISLQFCQIRIPSSALVNRL